MFYHNCKLFLWNYRADVIESKMINKQIQDKCDAAIVLAAWQSIFN